MLVSAENKKTLYVVFNKRNFKVVLETENKSEADSFVFNDSGLECSIYPPFTYAQNKTVPDLYDTTFLEY